MIGKAAKSSVGTGSALPSGLLADLIASYYGLEVKKAAAIQPGRKANDRTE